MINVVGQALERRARKRELLLARALDHAWQYRQDVVALSEKSGRGVQIIPDPIATAETYYRWLKELYDTGKLPKDPEILKTKEAMRRQRDPSPEDRT